jgi:hypothetical protein
MKNLCILLVATFLLSFCTRNNADTKTDSINEKSHTENKKIGDTYYISKDSSNILLDCHEVDSIYSTNDRCLLIDYLITNKWRTVFCLNKIITTFQVETGIKSRATFSDLNGYFYNSEKVLLEDLRKYKKAYKCH